tara:strand:+ start:3099 stop:3419 length:321 start_codon:yes stop_codon:yes gene_type:complete
MASCVFGDVRVYIQTDLSDADITTLITEADDDLTDVMGSTSLDTGQKKRACAYLAAAIIADKYPQSYNVGRVRIQHKDRGVYFRRRAMRIIAKQTGRVQAKDPLEE